MNRDDEEVHRLGEPERQMCLYILQDNLCKAKDHRNHADQGVKFVSWGECDGVVDEDDERENRNPLAERCWNWCLLAWKQHMIEAMQRESKRNERDHQIDHLWE